jgi:acetyltransferase-like isoleucine patch superfamily enzyme
MGSRLQKLRNDFPALVFARLTAWSFKINRMASGLITKTVWKASGIRFGSGCDFYGIPITQRVYNSSIEIGNNCRFRSSPSSNLIGLNRKCTIATHKQGAQIKIGNRCGLSGAVIGCSELITIDDDVLFGANSLVTDFDWHVVNPKERHLSGRSKSKPVHIKRNVWLGYGAVVLKGVTIGENSVITANSVVVTNIPANVIAGGNPAKVIKEIEV